jgi:predicted nucleotidyltransferase
MSSTSSVRTWPDRRAVLDAARDWAAAAAAGRPELLRVGVFGSYARGDWGFGSDLDLVLIVDDTRRPFADRPLDWSVRDLPVPSDLLVYTAEEWQRMLEAGSRFARLVEDSAVWLHGAA